MLGLGLRHRTRLHICNFTKYLTRHVSTLQSLQTTKNVCLERDSTTTYEAPFSHQSVNVLGFDYPRDSWTNVTPSILLKMGKKLYAKPKHPLFLIQKKIEKYFQTPRPRVSSVEHAVNMYLYSTKKQGNVDALKDRFPGGGFSYLIVDHLSPVVTVKQNFDDLCFPKDHVGRLPSDTYYINSELLLRTHTSAHEVELLAAQKTTTTTTNPLLLPPLLGFVTIGDVYRRDEIDTVHYPVFHQVEGVRRFDEHEMQCIKEACNILFPSPFSTLADGSELQSLGDVQPGYDLAIVAWIVADLKREVEGLMKSLFGSSSFRWISGDFPFTLPSFELEIHFRGKQLEVCGCGVLQQAILEKAGYHTFTSSSVATAAWAFGLGLERLAMILYDIPDIRLFWSEDERFLKQFEDADESTSITFEPFSKYPPVYRDISFWLPTHQVELHSNAVYDIIRDYASDLVEHVGLMDTFTHPEHQRKSHCYRITFRSMSKSLVDEEVNAIQDCIRQAFVDRFGVVLR